MWTALDLKELTKNPSAKPARITGFTGSILAILFIQLLFGAWVAGLNAGYVANTWPLMNDRFYPDGVDTAKGAFYALVNDPYLTHSWISANSSDQGHNKKRFQYLLE